VFDDGDEDRTNEAKDNDAVKPNEPIPHLSHVGSDVGIHLVKASVDMIKALLYTLRELFKLIFADKFFSHDVLYLQVFEGSYHIVLATASSPFGNGFPGGTRPILSHLQLATDRKNKAYLCHRVHVHPHSESVRRILSAYE
jgi:hypothetical protein